MPTAKPKTFAQARGTALAAAVKRRVTEIEEARLLKRKKKPVDVMKEYRSLVKQGRILVAKPPVRKK